MNNVNVTPKLYIACLAAYANGHLHGKWIQANQPLEAIWKEIEGILKSSPIHDAEEWAVHDYEGFMGISIDEYPNLEEVINIANLIAEHHGPMVAFLAWRKGEGYEIDFDTIKEEFQDKFCGIYEDENDFVLKSEEIEIQYDWKQFSKKFEFWSQYTDWDGLARDLFLTRYHSIKVHPFDLASYGIYVFRDF